MMDKSTKLGRLLVLGGSHGEGQGALVNALAEAWDLVVVETLDQALEQLRGEMFDAVVSGVGDFLPLERGMVSQQSAAVLNTIGQGVCITDRDGRILWQNRVMSQMPSGVIDRVRENARRAVEQFARGPLGPPGSPGRVRRFTAENEGRHYEMTISPLTEQMAGDQVRQVALVLWDVTSSRRLQQKLNAIDQAGRELLRLEADAVAKMNVQERLQLLERHILKYTRDLLNFDNFGIWLLDRQTNRLTLVLSDGFPDWVGDLELYALVEGNGITGHVANTGRSYICSDTSRDPRYITGIEGGRSSLTVPLTGLGGIIGVLNVESPQPGHFTEDDRQFAEIFGRYIALALNTLDLLAVERRASTDQFVANVAGEIDDPLNQIVSRAADLIEENVGNDALRDALNAIIDHATSIRQTVRQVAQTPTRVLGRHQVADADRDPVMDGKRVLIADDDQVILDDLCELLGKRGCVLELAHDGAEAMALVKTRSYDAIVCDIRMPHASGYDIYAAARNRSQKTPIIMMTGFGYDPKHSIFKARQEGVCGVLFKPFQAVDALERVREALTGNIK